MLNRTRRYGVAERSQDGVLAPEVALDRSSPVPLYYQVASRLQEQIEPPRGRRPVGLTSLYDDLAKTARTPRTEVRSLEVGPAGDVVAAALGLPSGHPVTNVERIRYADDEPLAIMHNVVPVDVVTLTAEVLERRGLYELLRS